MEKGRDLEARLIDSYIIQCQAEAQEGIFEYMCLLGMKNYSLCGFLGHLVESTWQQRYFFLLLKYCGFVGWVAFKETEVTIIGERCQKSV